MLVFLFIILFIHFFYFSLQGCGGQSYEYFFFQGCRQGHVQYSSHTKGDIDVLVFCFFFIRGTNSFRDLEITHNELSEQLKR